MAARGPEPHGDPDGAGGGRACLGRAAVALVGWFGSRGLASEVFALVALEEPGTPLADHAVAVITITVLLSVVVHGAMADPLATRSCRAFARERRAAALLQAGATVVGVFLPVIPVVFYLAVSVIFIVEPLRSIRIRTRRPTQPG